MAGSSPTSASAELAALVEHQVSLGPRVPGTAAHDRLADELAARLEHAGAEAHVQPFAVRFDGRTVACRNVVGVYRCGIPAAPLTLLATHYDTRPIGDREPDPGLRGTPIPGANDGGSGTAVLLHLLAWLGTACAGGGIERDVAVAFVDAEDLGDIDGNPFSLGAEHLAANPPAAVGRPDEVLALDMVGGRDLVLDVDAHVFHHAPSRDLAAGLFRMGASLGLAPFVRGKPERVKYIISDQWPFLRRGVPAGLLIDLDYPEWHTQADLPAAMSGESMAAIEAALMPWLSRPRAKAPRSSPGSGGP
jgi:Zn-dependent M28 family amino/carboxypeptidase